MSLEELIALARERGDWTLPILLHWKKLRDEARARNG